MRRSNGLYVWVAVLLIMVGGAGFVSYKLYKRMQAKKMRQWEGKMMLAVPDTLSTEEKEKIAGEMDARLDQDDVVLPVVEGMQLVSVWNLTDTAAAAKRVKESTRVVVEDGKVVFAVRDRDKELVGKLQKEIGQSYDRVVREQQGGVVPPPRESP